MSAVNLRLYKFGLAAAYQLHFLPTNKHSSVNHIILSRERAAAKRAKDSIVTYAADQEEHEEEDIYWRTKMTRGLEKKREICRFEKIATVCHFWTDKRMKFLRGIQTYRVVYKYSSQVPCIILKKFCCSLQNCTMAQYNSHPITKPGRIFYTTL